MTWIIGVIVTVVDADTFDIRIERSGGPYATGIFGNARIRMVNREVNALRPSFANPVGHDSVIGKRVYCEVHSRSADQILTVTARPA